MSLLSICRISSCVRCIDVTMPGFARAGFFGSTTALTTPTCSGPCSAGYICPSGSTSSTPIVCPAGQYSLPQSSACSKCPPGRFGDSSAASSARCAGPCQSGYYCLEGSTSSISAACPQGTFGGTSGLNTSACSGVCPAGYYCPIATVVPMPCGESRFYCPLGSSGPLAATGGVYTWGGLGASTRIDITLCEVGSYCTGGVRVLCPSG